MTFFEAVFGHPAATYAQGKLVFLSRLPGEVRILILAGLVALAWGLYRKASARVSRRAGKALLTLRIGLIALLVFILGRPALRIATPRASSIFTAVLLDASRSMSIDDVPAADGPVTREAAAVDLLAARPGDEPSVLDRLRGLSRVHCYLFHQKAVRVPGPQAARAEGRATNIFGAIRDVETDLRAVPLAAVVLLTDGCRNEGGLTDEAARVLEARGVPLFVVGLGDPRPPRDYEVLQVFAPRRVRRNTEVEVQVAVRHTDFHAPFELRILHGDTPLVSKTIEPSKSSDITSLRITFTPDAEASATYTLAVPPADGERVTRNNSRDFTIDIADDRLPVLYIEGSPRKEYRFLRRALFRDRDFRLVGLLRLARDRFYVQGASAAERYLEGGFPDTRERLFAFETVILGDIEASYFSRAQHDLLEAFVRERGGGILMLGGVNSFGLGKYANTPVGTMLPLAVSPTDPPYVIETFHAKATPKGLQHPVMRLAPDPDANRRLWENAPPLIGITPVSGVKPGSLPLLVHEDGRRPVLAVQNYGAGRVAAFTSGGSWYWQVSMPAADPFHEKFWKQLIRWLAVGAKEQLTVETDAGVYARREPVLIRATVLAKDLRPINDAAVAAAVTDPFGNTEQLAMDWILSQEGVYQCRYVPDEEGNYTVTATVADSAAPPAVTGFLVGQPVLEFANAGLKEDALRRMAEIAGGRYFRVAEAGELPAAVAEAVGTARLAGARTHDEEIWDSPFALVLLLGIMGAEWTIRRRAGLA